MHWAAVKAGVPCQSALEWKLFVAYFVVILCAGDRRHSSRAFGKLFIVWNIFPLKISLSFCGNFMCVDRRQNLNAWGKKEYFAIIFALVKRTLHIKSPCALETSETLRLIVKSDFWNIWQKSRPRKITLQYIVKSSNYNAANTDSLRSHNAVGIYDSGLGHSHNLIAVSATHTLTQDARIPMHESKLSFSNCRVC